MTDEQQKSEQQEVGLYEKIASRTADLLEEGKKTVDEALKKASEEIDKVGGFSNEHLEKIVSYVRRDLREHAETAGETVKKTVDPQRVATGVQSVFSRILLSTSDALIDLATKTEKSLEFRTGEVTSIGTLTCKECGAEMHLTKTVRIPPCPKCHKTVFRKSY